MSMWPNFDKTYYGVFNTIYFSLHLSINSKHIDIVLETLMLRYWSELRQYMYFKHAYLGQ
jgi:hypothetical protein